MTNSTRKVICLLFCALLFGGCDDSEESRTSAPQPMSPAPAESGHGGDAEKNELHVVLLPNVPTVKTSLYARVSGAREPVRLAWLKNGETIEGEVLHSLGVEHLRKGDMIEVEATSGDLRGGASVVVGNSPPTINAVNFNYGSTVSVQPLGEDPDGDSITYNYQWLVNEQEILSESVNILPGTFFAQGDRVAVEITPSDDESEGAKVRLEDVLIANKPPVIRSTPPAFFEGGEFLYQVVADDPEKETLVYSLDTAPAGMKIDSQTGEVFWRSTGANPGPYLVKIKVADSSGRWSVQEFTLNLGSP